MSQTQTGNPKIETEESLRSSRELLKQFASHLQTLREEEKVNLSRELHDGLGQSLAGLKIYAHRIFKDLNDDRPDAKVESMREQAAEMIRIIDSTLKVVKKIAKDIRPRILDEFGLVSAIEIFIKEFSESRKLKYELIKETRKIEIDKPSSLEVYRIIQETISHVICKPDSTMLTVKITDEPHYYFIEIRDDARGQNESVFFELNSIRIMGLRERAKVLEGDLQISVDKNTGMKVVLSIPKKETK